MDYKEIVKFVNESIKEIREKKAPDLNLKDKEESVIEILEPQEELEWDQHLHKILLSIDPIAFERLIQRMLRESGFIQVQVTGKSGDGGIDGVGIARINGFLSF